MKRTMARKFAWLITALLAVIVAAILGACGSAESETSKVTDLSFDFQTGEYSFTGIGDDVSYYRVRIFASVDGEPDELPSNETQDLRGGKDSYSGTLEIWSLTPGDTYFVYARAVFTDGTTSDSDALEGEYIYQPDAVTSGVSATIDGTTVTVTLTDDAVSDTYEYECSYLVKLYSGTELIDSATLTQSDIGIVEEEGISGTTTSYEAVATFTVDDADGEYTVTVTVISTQSFLVDSEESEAFEVTAETEEESIDAE